MSDRISFIVRLPAKPGHVEELKKGLLFVTDQMANEPDFVTTWIHHPVDDPDTIVLYETWDCSMEYFMSHHMKASYRADYEAVLSKVLRTERSFEFLVPFKEYPKAT
ncbi:oxidoreductase [Pseudomonas agarici]|uniref:Oxidoreductase n=1 Tax=Pseudomonas agarici TaxID=46677 RepID=A0A0X1T680_PSEAA|nr:antibiotic biosynthesis monooxygenase [Pseudomonas agarici]AMB87617.1 oxidoreductase [Pseudomonas agarici]NWB89979.1 antibiotic biosynthesis monooxygenase [Pseudomonas agarici]NWC08240.1 antibiotic biosynthesis monooxygenase [Pseudomonas agarici]SEK83056.1 Quinol monooxygenase YgiN [Pseudomonas agarici]